jgi:hypothetical protein
MCFALSADAFKRAAAHRDAVRIPLAAVVDVRGTRAIATGGAFRIGVATARAFAATGAAVTLALRSSGTHAHVYWLALRG